MTIACQRLSSTGWRVRKTASMEVGPAAATRGGSARPSRRGAGPPWRTQKSPPTEVIAAKNTLQTTRPRLPWEALRVAVVRLDLPLIELACAALEFGCESWRDKRIGIQCGR